MSILPYKPEIRFADIDAMGHVNNAVYFNYFEQARIHFFNNLIGEVWNWTEKGIIVVRNEIDYSLPLFLNDSVLIEVTCSAIGTKSFTLHYKIKKLLDGHTVVCSIGSSVLVCFDYHSKKSISVPAMWREKLQSLAARAKK